MNLDCRSYRMEIEKKDSKNAKLFATLALAFAAITVVFGAWSLPRLKTEYSVMQFLPANHPSIRMDAAVRKLFGIEDKPTFIGILTLKENESGNWLTSEKMARLSAMTKSIQAMPGIDMALSISNVSGAASTDGSLAIGELVTLVPPKDWEKRILQDKLLTPNLIAQDGRTIVVYIQLKDAAVSGMVQAKSDFTKMLAAAFPEAATDVGGVPAIQTDLGLLLNKELLNFLILTIIACAVTLLLIFRTRSTIWIPLILTLYCNLMVFTFMAWSGITFTILSSTIPILVFIDVMTISCHILLRFHEESQRSAGASKFTIILRVVRLIWLPNALGSLTTSVGFLTLLMSDVPLIRTYGLAVAVSILISSLLTTLGTIPLLLLFPSPIPRVWVHRPARWALWVMHQHRIVIAGTVAICCAFALIGRQLDWTGRLFDDLPSEQAARRTTERIDQSMGGVVPLDITVRTPNQTDWVDPERIAKMDHLLTDLRQLDGVGTAQSLPDFLRVSGLRDGELPTTRRAIAETYFLYGLSENNPLARYLTSDNQSARIELKIHDLPSDQVQVLLSQLQNRVQKEFADSEVQIGGMGAIVHTIHDEISHELIFGFWQALLLIVALLAIVFRSLRWAAVAAIPNLAPPVILLGYLALTHTAIKPGVAIIFSIALGLAFTNTVYALNRLRELREPGRNLPVRKTFHLESNPCLVSTLVVMMGFSVFLFSYFELNRTFGACMLVSILAGILGDLIFLPALLQAAPWLLQNPIAKIEKQDAPVPVIPLPHTPPGLDRPASAEEERVAA